MQFVKGFCLTASLAVLVGAASMSARAATTIDTSPSWTGVQVGVFGVPNTATVGQTFTAGSDNVLNNFTFYLDGAAASGPITSKAYVYAWNGAKATGSSLFSTPTFTIAGSTVSDPYTINTGSLVLTAGDQYVAFFSTSGLQGSQGNNGTNFNIDYPADAYSGGSLVFFANGDNFSQLTSNNWSTFGGPDLRFQANFSAGSGSTVPEPSSAAFLIIGAAFVGALALRRRTARAI